MPSNRILKIAVLAAITAAACLVAVFMNFRQLDVIFTSLFYIPMILAGIWFYRRIISLTILFVVLFLILDIVSPGPGLIRLEQLLRGVILIAGAVLFYFMGRQLEQSRQQLAIEKERFRVTLLSINDGVASTDEKGGIVLLNDVASRLAGWPDGGAEGKPFREVFKLVDEYTGCARGDVVAGVLAGKRAEELAEHTVLVSRDGRETPVSVSAAPIQGEKTGAGGVVLVLRDMTAVQRKQNELEYQSLHDQLTGLGNRRMLELQVKRLIREKTLPISVIVGDVNGLKLTNDALGHAMGDQLLQKAAETLRGVLREDDIICRYGGDEFTMLLPGTGGEQAAQIMKRLCRAIAETTMGPVCLSISLGYAAMNDDDINIMDVMRAAEDMMYANKLTESVETKKSIIANMVDNSGIHGAHTAQLCALAIDAYGLKGRDARDLETACMVRDIGRMAVGEAGWHDARRYIKEDAEAEKRHAEIGFRILNMVPDYAGIADYVLAHHERWDGAGHPKGLAGEEIPYLSRIIAVVDYADLLSDAVNADAAARLMKHAGTRFDPDVADVFAQKVLNVMNPDASTAGQLKG